jgi:hypothetical protein
VLQQLRLHAVAQDRLGSDPVGVGHQGPVLAHEVAEPSLGEVISAVKVGCLFVCLFSATIFF